MTSAQSPASLSAPAQVRILLIDDDPDQRLVVTGLLAQRGFRDVSEAPDADEGLQLASTAAPHLVLLDLAMPGRPGIEVLPDLHAAAPEAAIVVLSNMPRRRLLGEVLRRGAVGFVEKAIPPDRLVDEILIAAALTDLARTHVLELAAAATAPGRGRRFTSALLEDADQRVVADVELLVSELITNAVMHTGSEPRLEVHMLRDRIRVEVYDDDPNPPLMLDQDLTRPGGRGLRLISTLSDRWGTERVGAGKLVWIELDQR
jgi:DNA-binding NarL/FixJ family response regulator